MKSFELHATDQNPIAIYYCKAGIQTGTTIRVMHASKVYATGAVVLGNSTAEMHHDNSTGKAKKSGARCVLMVSSGTVSFSTNE